MTVADLTKIVDDLAVRMSSGGEMTVKYLASFQDGGKFERESSQAFLDHIDSDGDPFDQITVDVLAWSSPELNRDIVKSFHLSLAWYGSSFQVGSADPVWGRGAVGEVKERFARYSPRYAWLLHAMPYAFGALAPLLVFSVVVAWLHTPRNIALAIVVTVLSTVVLVTMVWLIRASGKGRLLAHTVVLRSPRTRSWTWLKVVTGGVALAANVVTLIVLLAR